LPRLLAIGVLDSSGDFKKGDVVALCDQAGVEFARGLTNYTATELAKIKGQKTENIRAILGASAYDEVIHRDNMAVTTRREA
jgi:glutamate 5-kinase